MPATSRVAALPNWFRLNKAHKVALLAPILGPNGPQAIEKIVTVLKESSDLPKETKFNLDNFNQDKMEISPADIAPHRTIN